MALYTSLILVAVVCPHLPSALPTPSFYWSSTLSALFSKGANSVVVIRKDWVPGLVPFVPQKF